MWGAGVEGTSAVNSLRDADETMVVIQSSLRCAIRLDAENMHPKRKYFKHYLNLQYGILLSSPNYCRAFPGVSGSSCLSLLHSIALRVLWICLPSVSTCFRNRSLRSRAHFCSVAQLSHLIGDLSWFEMSLSAQGYKSGPP